MMTRLSRPPGKNSLSHSMPWPFIASVVGVADRATTASWSLFPPVSSRTSNRMSPSSTPIRPCDITLRNIRLLLAHGICRQMPVSVSSRAARRPLVPALPSQLPLEGLLIARHCFIVCSMRSQQVVTQISIPLKHKSETHHVVGVIC